MSSSHQRPDAIDRATGLDPSHPVFDLRKHRAEIATGSEISRASVLEPDDDLGLSRALRCSVARRVALSGENAGLLAEYPAPDDATLAVLAKGNMPDDPKLAVLARHADMIASSPNAASDQHLKTLMDAGYTVPQIVALSELIAQVCYQIRVTHGLALLKEMND
jgi:uncharacterized protein YciW